MYTKCCWCWWRRPWCDPYHIEWNEEYSAKFDQKEVRIDITARVLLHVSNATTIKSLADADPYVSTVCDYIRGSRDIQWSHYNQLTNMKKPQSSDMDDLDSLLSFQTEAPPYSFLYPQGIQATCSCHHQRTFSPKCVRKEDSSLLVSWLRFSYTKTFLVIFVLCPSFI